MSLYREAGALKVFYYLLAVDGDVRPVELQRLTQVGEALAPGAFPSYRQTMILDCNARLARARDDVSRFNIAVNESINALRFARNNEVGIKDRLVAWDLLVIAYCDGDYSGIEKEFVRVVAAELGIDKEMTDEMSYLIESAFEAEKQLDWATSMELPFNELRPIVESIEVRLDTIRVCARDFLIDEDIDWQDDSIERRPHEIKTTQEFIERKTADVQKKFGVFAANKAQPDGQVEEPNDRRDASQNDGVLAKFSSILSNGMSFDDTTDRFAELKEAQDAYMRKMDDAAKQAESIAADISRRASIVDESYGVALEDAKKAMASAFDNLLGGFKSKGDDR